MPNRRPAGLLKWTCRNQHLVRPVARCHHGGGDRSAGYRVTGDREFQLSSIFLQGTDHGRRCSTEILVWLMARSFSRNAPLLRKGCPRAGSGPASRPEGPGPGAEGGYPAWIPFLGTIPCNIRYKSCVEPTAARASKPKAYLITGDISLAALKVPVQARKPGDQDTRKPAP